jgi:hypothetical protein
MLRAAALALVSSSAHAAKPYVWQRLAGTLNPLGANTELRVESRSGLPWSDAGDRLRAGTFAGWGGDVEISPAYLRVGPRLSFSPLAVFEVSAQARLVQYFGAFGTLLSFSSTDSPYDEDAREARADEARAETGLDVDVRPELRARLGPLVVANSWEIHYLHVPGDRPFVYEPYFDLLVARGGWVWWTDVVAGAFVWDPPGDRMALLAGMWTWSRAEKTGDRSSSVGPLFAVKPVSGTFWPAVLVLTRAYLSDRLQERGSIYFALGLRWSSD